MTETEWAIRNLELAGFFDKDSDYEGMIGEAVKRLLLCHAQEGHSGASHYQTLRVFNLVANGQQALTQRFWDERFKDYNEFAIKNGGGPWTEAEFEKQVLKKPAPRTESGGEK